MFFSGRRNPAFTGAIRGILRRGSALFDAKLVFDPLLGMSATNPLDLRSLSLATLARHLDHTLVLSEDMRTNFPILEKPYRCKRRWLAVSGLSLASNRMVLAGRRAADCGRIVAVRQIASVLKACVWRVQYR